jgi:hypothetical protein
VNAHFKLIPFNVIYFGRIRLAKQMKKRIWKDYEPSSPSIAIDNKEFTGKVQKYLHIIIE